VKQKPSKKTINILCAIVDIVASKGFLVPALAAMELCQMIVQAVSEGDSTLMQIPHFTQEMVLKAQELNIKDLDDFMEQDEQVISKLLKGLSPKQQKEAALFVNSFPNIEVTPKRNENKISVTLDTEELPSVVIAPFFPGPRKESWWLVVGSGEVLLFIKKFQFAKNQMVFDFEIAPPDPNTPVKLFLMSDSYRSADQEIELK